MIGDGDGNAWIIALRDALIVFAGTFLATLAGYGFPPGWEALYTAAIAGAIIFIASLRASFGVRLPPPSDGDSGGP